MNRNSKPSSKQARFFNGQACPLLDKKPILPVKNNAKSMTLNGQDHKRARINSCLLKITEIQQLQTDKKTHPKGEGVRACPLPVPAPLGTFSLSPKSPPPVGTGEKPPTINRRSEPWRQPRPPRPVPRLTTRRRQYESIESR